MSGFRYKHTVSLTFKGGTGLHPSAESTSAVFDPAEIVDGFETCDDDFLPSYEKSNRYKCWLKRDITLLISSIHMPTIHDVDNIFVLRLGGEIDDRPHDVMLKMAPGVQDVHLIPLPLPSRMRFYMVIPNKACVTIVGRATSDVPPPAEKGIS